MHGGVVDVRGCERGQAHHVDGISLAPSITATGVPETVTETPNSLGVWGSLDFQDKDYVLAPGEDAGARLARDLDDWVGRHRALYWHYPHYSNQGACHALGKSALL